MTYERYNFFTIASETGAKPIHGIGVAFSSVPKIEKNRHHYCGIASKASSKVARRSFIKRSRSTSSHSASPITLVTVIDHQPPPPFSAVTLPHHIVAAPRPSHLIPSPSPSQEPSPWSPSSSQKSQPVVVSAVFKPSSSFSISFKPSQPSMLSSGKTSFEGVAGSGEAASYIPRKASEEASCCYPLGACRLLFEFKHASTQGLGIST
ncbi:hypothetical protein PIB30_070198, partial [Stylosanthes scabra]|nr:hypothetical protein [Stylosanthes scabra]